LFTIDDFTQLMRYFRGDSVPNLDTNLIILAEDSKAKATTLFNENIDLACYATEDYKRLRNFLIPWYASLRSFSSTMRSASDVRSLPEDHLNELINSFGFVDGLDELSHSNKIDFFYDLVNLYKIKGTPESVERVLGYFGIPDVELVEYWLQYNSSGQLVFHPVKISIPVPGSLTVVAPDIDYDYIINSDPHWFLTKNQVNQLFQTNRIAFPSKSPYFGIRPTTQLSGNIINPTIAILSRMVQDQYAGYVGGTPPVKDIKLTVLNIFASLLDLYLAVLYTFNTIYVKTNDSADTSFLIYDESMLLTNEQIYDLYDTITSRANSQTRAQLEANKLLLNDYFSRLRTTNFITNLSTAGTVLNLTNNDLKNLIDNYISLGNEDYLLKLLLKDLSSWVKDHISDSAPNLSSLILGFASLEYITDVINFFKPYRARLILVEHIYTIDNPISDAVICEDELNHVDTETIVDFDTANSTGCCCPEDVIPCLDSTASIYYSRNTYDCGSNFDIGASIDDDQGITIHISDNIYDIYNYHHGDATACVHLSYTLDSTGEIEFALQDGGFIDFDNDGIFDAPQISDACHIYVQSVGP